MKSKPKEHYSRITDAELIADLMAVSKKLERDTLGASDYIIHGQFSYCELWKRFGDWRAALQMAGLKPVTAPRKNITEEDLFKNLADVWMKLGRQPGMKEMKSPLSAYNYALYIWSFGSWLKALKKFVEYGNASSPTDPLSDPCANAIGEGEPPVERDKRAIPHRMRFSVFLRDGFRCCACGKSPLTHPGVELHCDHIDPWGNGGKTVMYNLRTLCAECNLGKGDMLEEKNAD